MRRREAKRIVAAHLAHHAFDVAHALAGEYPGDDAERIKESCYEFAEELYRRAGLDQQAQQVDERQLSIYDVLG